MKLYLIQHGDSVSKEVNPDRPLSAEGERDVKQVAGFLKRAGVPVSKILHSGKTRARQTAEILATALHTNGDIEAITGIDPNDPMEPFAASLLQLNTGTMIVGHLPFMARLVSYLITGNDDQPIVAYQPGGVVCLEQNENKIWQIQWMIRPDLLS
jgi:phosphohistidine phosphatase SixA